MIPDDVAAAMNEAGSRGSAERESWRERFDAWSSSDPGKAAEWDRRMARELPVGLADALPGFTEDAIATRKAQVKILAALAHEVPEIVGGSADLTGSNGTALDDVEAFEPGKPGRYIHYGVREHAMAGAMNGIVVHGGLRPYGGTFLIFSDYHKNSVRLAALMGVPTIFVYSHDSIGLGEDGPTHQPIEQIAGLRAIPNLAVFRPGDANETAQSWRVALERTDGPSVIIVTRQNLPVIDQVIYSPAIGVERGAYTLIEHGPGNTDPEVILIATGSEVQVAVEAAKELASEGTLARVVSMPCWELFEAQDQAYRDEVLPPSVTARVAIEAAASFGWERWVGDRGAMITVDRFGASAPGATVMTEYGFTAEHAAELARSLID